MYNWVLPSILGKFYSYQTYQYALDDHTIKILAA